MGDEITRQQPLIPETFDPETRTAEPRRSPPGVVGLEGARGLHWLALVLPPLLAFDVWLLAHGGSWQGWLGLVGTLIGSALAALAALFSHKSRQPLARLLSLASLATALIIHELAVGGLTIPIALVGAVTMALVGRRARPRQRRMRLFRSVVFLAVIGVIEVWEPLPRQTVPESLDSNILLATAVIVLIAVVAWVLFRIARAGSIRTRLVVSYTLMALLPVALLGGTALNQAYRTQRDHVEAELELTVARREAAIRLWLEQLQSDLDNVLAGGELLRRATMLLETGDPSLVLRDYSVMQDRFAEIMGKSGRLSEIFLLDRYGRVIVSTDRRQEGAAYNNEIFFQKGRLGTYIQAPYTTPAAEHRLITIVQPVRSSSGEIIGLIGGRANLNVMNRIMQEPSQLGATGETYVVGRNQRLLTEPTAGAQKGAYVTTVAVQTALDNEVSGSGVYLNQGGVPVVGVFRWLPELQAVLLAEQARSEAFQPIYATLGTVALVALTALFLAALVGLVSSRAIVRPLTVLADTATQIAAGNLGLTSPVDSQDEIGILASAFNKMTGQLRVLISGLEERVAARTQELEERSRFLEAATMVGSAAASMLESEPLIRRVVDLIQDHFDLYYVGLFLVDASGRWAALKAGTGEAGRRMLARGHRIPVGEGMVGWCIEHSQSRVAGEAVDDSVRLWVDELPETRSEAAIPLRVRGRTIGALTVQDRHPQTFDDDLVTALQMMADQVAVALENARLFAEVEEALETAQRAYGELTGQAWGELLRLKPGLGFRCTEAGLSPAGPLSGGPRLVPGENALSLPIQVRGQAIGTLETHKPTDWSREEIALLNKVVDQLGAALDNARLFEETQRRAAREHLARQIAEKLRTLTQVEAIASTAADELGRALGTEASFVTLGLPESGPGNGHDPI
jgi:GAF domain-containing protein/HAMP domain-containing protein